MFDPAYYAQRANTGWFGPEELSRTAAKQEELDDYTPQWFTYEALKDETSRFIGVTAGVGSGKTDTGVLFSLDRSIKNHLSPIMWCLMPTYSKIADTLIPRFRKLLPALGYKHGTHWMIRPKSAQTPILRIEFAWGNEIHFWGADRLDLLVATEIHSAWIDEPGKMKKGVISEVNERLRDPLAESHQILCTGVPQGALGEYAEMFNFSEENSTVPHGTMFPDKEFTRQSGPYRRIIAHTSDNPHLPDGYIEGLKAKYGKNKNLELAHIYGEFTSLTGSPAYPDFDRERHIVHWEPDPSRSTVLSFDYNVDPMSWATLQEYNATSEQGPYKMLIVADCSDLTNSTVGAATEEWMQRHPVEKWRNTPIEIDGDSQGHRRTVMADGNPFDRTKQMLKARGYTNVTIAARNYNPPESDSIDCMCDAFRGDVLLIGHLALEVARSIESTETQEGRRKIKKTAGEQHTHLGDTVKYPVFRLEQEESIVSGRIKLMSVLY